jgi:hypothetical protein
LLPSQYAHAPSSGPFYKNITGFYRDATVYPVDLLAEESVTTSTYFDNVYIPNLNTSSWNDTMAQERIGEWDWSSTTTFNMHLRERHITSKVGDDTPNENFTDWTWVKGSITLTTSFGPSEDDAKDIEYEFYGVHHVPNGTYDLYGLPDGKRIDIRNIPLLVTAEGYEPVRDIIMLELEKDLSTQKDTLLLMNAKEDSEYGPQASYQVDTTTGRNIADADNRYNFDIMSASGPFDSPSATSWMVSPCNGHIRARVARSHRSAMESAASPGVLARHRAGRHRHRRWMWMGFRH